MGVVDGYGTVVQASKQPRLRWMEIDRFDTFTPLEELSLYRWVRYDLQDTSSPYFYIQLHFYILLEMTAKSIEMRGGNKRCERMKGMSV